MKSFTNEKIGKRLSVRQLPICCLRSQLNDRKQKCKSAEPYYWMSEEDKRKLAERKRCFDRQWSAEITKRLINPISIHIFSLFGFCSIEFVLQDNKDTEIFICSKKQTTQK